MIGQWWTQGNSFYISLHFNAFVVCVPSYAVSGKSWSFWFCGRGLSVISSWNQISCNEELIEMEEGGTFLRNGRHICITDIGRWSMNKIYFCKQSPMQPLRSFLPINSCDISTSAKQLCLMLWISFNRIYVSCMKALTSHSLLLTKILDLEVFTIEKGRVSA